MSTTTTASAYAALMQSHRSIRSYEDRPLPTGLVDTVLEQALAGTSSSGNLNLVSVIKTQDLEKKSGCLICTASSPWSYRRRWF